MCGEQGFIAVRETVHLVKFIGKGCSIFFRVFMLRYLVLQDIMYYLAAQQQNKLIQFPVFADIGVVLILDILSQACEKHIQTRFLAISVLEYYRHYTANNVMSCLSA